MEGLLDKLVENLPITEKWVNVKWDRTIRFIVAGEPLVGKSTLLRELFRGRVPCDNMARATNPNDEWYVSCSVTRHLSDDDKKFLKEDSDTIEVTIEGHESIYYQTQFLNKINRSRTEHRPIHMVLYCFRERLTSKETDFCVKVASLGVPILPVKTFNYTDSNIDFGNIRKDLPIYDPIGVLAQDVECPNNDGTVVKIPSSGMLNLVENIGKIFEEHSIHLCSPTESSLWSKFINLFL